jgi:hypothetical protein
MELENFPHHFHNIDGKIQGTPLRGDPAYDLTLVLAELKRPFGHQA